MVQEGDKAPDFTVPRVTADEVDEFTLSDEVGDGPVVLAFFPGAFTSGCRTEMCDFRDELGSSSRSTRLCTALASTVLSRNRRS